MDPIPVVDACGDADGNRVLSVTDGIRVLRAAAGLGDDCSPYRCDVDGSGAVTVTDGVGVLSRAAGLMGLGFYGCPVPHEVHDVSDFTSFHLTRMSGLGFCPELGSVLEVDIERVAATTYRLHLTVAAERPRGDPECVLPFSADDPTCVAPEPRPDRVLTADEVDRVQGAFASVDVLEARDPWCAIGVVDPCVIDALRWDELEVDDYEHSGQRVDGATASALIAVLDTLVLPPPAGE